MQAIIDKKTEGYNQNDLKIKVKIEDIGEFIYIHIEDNGIGINSNNLAKIWLYSFSSNPIPAKNIIEDIDFSNNTPLSGFGYGLPISKIYLGFFDGHIFIESFYKKGTNVYLFLRKLNICSK